MLTQRLFPNFPFLTEPKDPLLLCSVFRESGSHPPLTHFPDHSPRVSELPGVDRPGEDLEYRGEVGRTLCLAPPDMGWEAHGPGSCWRS